MCIGAYCAKALPAPSSAPPAISVTTIEREVFLMAFMAILPFEFVASDGWIDRDGHEIRRSLETHFSGADLSQT
ncbi:hypothetical protein PPGU19_055650 [Paraburkholderia sp. PGU19]|nr:hypothetical protein PPGU19_055650 [Paraburkholderia sp. PGU19]